MGRRWRIRWLREFLTLLLQREEDLHRCLAEKMLVYALGRPIDFSDDEHLNAILEKVKADGGKLSTLVAEIAMSELFRTK